MSNTAIQDIEDIQTILKAHFPIVNVDGDIGKITMTSAAELSDPMDARSIQTILATRYAITVDGIIGPRTLQILGLLDVAGDQESLAELKGDGTIIKSGVIKASFFAGPEDVGAFRSCKARGNSDQYCFAYGDNGIGKWGKDCTSQDVGMVALPRETWLDAGKTGGAKVFVSYKGKSLVALLEDTMPAIKNIKNGCRMDLNPGCAVAFGIPPAKMNEFTLEGVSWDWA